MTGACQKQRKESWGKTETPLWGIENQRYLEEIQILYTPERKTKDSEVIS